MTIISSLQGKEKPTSGSPTKRTQYVLSEPSTDDTSDGEVADHDSYHVEKKRRLTGEQVRSLEMSFEVENKLEAEKKLKLAKELGLQPRQVAIWFQNRRARWKTKQLEKDYDILKAAYESLLSEREKLQAEIASLNVKLETSSRKSGLEAKRKDADDQSKSTILNDHLAWKPASNKLDKAEILMLKQANAESEELQLHSPVTSDDASFDSHGGSSVNNNFEQRTRGQSANRLCPIGVDFEHKTVCVLPCVHHISFKQEDGCGHEESYNNSFFTLDEHGGWPWYWD